MFGYSLDDKTETEYLKKKSNTEHLLILVNAKKKSTTYTILYSTWATSGCNRICQYICHIARSCNGPLKCTFHKVNSFSPAPLITELGDKEDHLKAKLSIKLSRQNWRLKTHFVRLHKCLSLSLSLFNSSTATLAESA